MDMLLNEYIPRLVTTVMWISSVISKPQDVCLWNSFDANCAKNEVIHMEYAHYGRMSVGSCIPKKAGYEMGCQEDVLGYLDSMCSGRQTCQLRLTDYLANKDQPCPLGWTSYLQLQYSCKGVHVSVKECAGDSLLVQDTQGLLSSVITELTGHGSSECPWLVRGSPGQKVRLTLHDYGVWIPPTSETGGAAGQEPGVRDTERSDICHIYARITEVLPLDSTMRSITLCGGETRQKVVYLSETESLQIALTNPRSTQHAAYFLLQYEITGCPDYPPPEGAVIERTETGISVKCTSTGNEWHLSCDGTRWSLKQEIINCTSSGGPSLNMGALVNSFLTIPQWILILMILAVAVIIAVPIIVIGCVGLRRKNDSVMASHQNFTMDYGKCMPEPGHDAKELEAMFDRGDSAQTSLRRREYVSTAHEQVDVRPGVPSGRFPPLPLPPTASMPDAENCLVHRTLGHDRHMTDSRQSTYGPPYIEHNYESPIVIQRPRSKSENSGTFYNKLGLDDTHLQTTPPSEYAESGTETFGLDALESTLPL